MSANMDRSGVIGGPLRRGPRLRRVLLVVEDDQGRTFSRELDGRAVRLDVEIKREQDSQPSRIPYEYHDPFEEENRPFRDQISIMITGEVDHPEAAPEGWMLMRVDPSLPDLR